MSHERLTKQNPKGASFLQVLLWTGANNQVVFQLVWSFLGHSDRCSARTACLFLQLTIYWELLVLLFHCWPVKPFVHCLGAFCSNLPLSYGLPALVCWWLLFPLFACVLMLLLIAPQVTEAHTLSSHQFHEEFELLRQNTALFCLLSDPLRPTVYSGGYL